MTRVYLSGAMSGKPDLNFPLFNAEAARLRSLGYDVVNPVELCPDPAATWHDCLKADIKALLDCDAIVMLPGWVDSQGAMTSAGSLCTAKSGSKHTDRSRPST